MTLLNCKKDDNLLEKQRYVGDVVYLEMTHAPFVPFTRSWPPESTVEFKRWIFEGTEGEILLEQLF
ncbi:hypothetical protein, partial [Vibrio anguillarum]